MSRPYTLRRRADSMDDTRRRIARAAAELHGTLGPARTTISAVAHLAGVERLTVYRHFPNEAALFQACSRHWLAEHSPPDPAAWSRIADPSARLGSALDEMYGYYEGTCQMWERVYRDAPLVPALGEPMRQWGAHLERACDILAAGWGARGRRRRLVRTAVTHALDFPAWASLARHGADRDTARALMTALVHAAAGRPAAIR